MFFINNNGNFGVPLDKGSFKAIYTTLGNILYQKQVYNCLKSNPEVTEQIICLQKPACQ